MLPAYSLLNMDRALPEFVYSFILLYIYHRFEIASVRTAWYARENKNLRINMLRNFADKLSISY